jgi:hypothetical protein
MLTSFLRAGIAMKITILTVLVATASAFTVVPGHLHRGSTTLQAGDIYSELSRLEGPSICWGPEGTLQGYDELAIREYDNFVFFKNAIDQAGLAKTLRSIGPYTLLLPVDSACEAFAGQLDEELIKYHIVLGDVYSDEMTTTFETLNGNILTCRHEFRRILADDALIGQKDNHTGGSMYPTDIKCDNGIIHAINTVLVPGYTKAGNQEGPGS